MNQSEVYVVRLVVKPLDDLKEQFKVHNLGGREEEGAFLQERPRTAVQQEAGNEVKLIGSQCTYVNRKGVKNRFT